MEIQGIVEEIIFTNKENGYTIASIDHDMELLIVVGYMPLVKEGEMMRFVGEPSFHKTYGEQFKVSSCEVMEPTETKSIMKYLASGIIKGIGPSLAERIVKEFGEDTLDIIRYNPTKLLKVQGIGQNKLDMIVKSYAATRAMSDIVMFLQKYEVSLAYATKIYNEYREKTIDKVTENPYILAEEIKGIGFRMADDIAKLMGVDKDSPYRIYSGIKHVMTLITNQGHTYSYEEALIKEASEILFVSKECIKTELTELIIKGELHRTMFDDVSVIYLTPYYNAELYVCKKISKLTYSQIEMMMVDVEKEIDLCEKEGSIELADQQKESISQSINQGVMVITGGPGTGKTTIINSIIDIFERQNLKVLLAAPTGRAAKRMSEATKHEAKTIHRLLEYQFSDAGYLAFNKDRDNPLVADLIIIDEASMLDIMLTNNLLDAISDGTRVIFVGDVDQLPAVGAGNVLSDIIESGFIKTVALTEIFRQAQESMIVTNAHKINTGQIPIVNEKDKDFFFIKQNSAKGVIDTIVGLCKERLPNFYKFDSVKDIQVLAPMKNSPAGVINLNQCLQHALNPPSQAKAEKPFGDTIFREGDKIMQIKNNYNIEWKERYTHNRGKGVFNGDIGYIQEVNKERKTLLVLFDDDREVEYEFGQLDELVLSYAVTVHKSQGSEFPVIVMPLFNVPPMLRNKNILYTAITRAKSLVVLVGTEIQLKGMIQNVSHARRNSGLIYMFKLIEEVFKEDKIGQNSEKEIEEIEEIKEVKEVIEMDLEKESKE